MPKGSDFKKTQIVFLILNKLLGPMGRNRHALYLILSLFILSSSFLSFPSETIILSSANSVREDKFNLLLITIDTLRADSLSCYGSNSVKTPNIDGLAEKGILFKKAFAHTSTTLPSHANILIGVTPLSHGVHDNSNFIVREEFLTLAEHLKGFGYSTGAVVGAYPLDSRFGLNQGFDFYDDDYGNQNFQNPFYIERKAEEVVDIASKWLKGQREPWFLWVHCFDPHFPYESPEPFRSEFKGHPYDGEVAYVDFCLGELFSYLRNEGAFEKTVIVFTADHGESLGEHGEKTHGYFAYNSTIRVPLIVYLPGAGKNQVNQTVSHIDIFPTVCDVLNVEKPSFLQGSSLLLLFKGKKLSEKPIYFESLYPYYSRGWAPLRGYISGLEKFIESPIPEIYDLEEDFDELLNLAERRKLDKYKSKLASIIKDQSQPEEEESHRIDREAVEKLKSLGYISSRQVIKKENFTGESDVKILLPYHNKSSEALDLYHAGKVEDAISLLREIITEKKDIETPYLNLAKIYKEKGKLRNALEILKLAIEHLPLNYDIFLTYISYLLRAGQYDVVIDVFEKKEYRRMRFDPEIWNSVGVAYLSRRETEKAVEAFEVAISLDGDYPVAYNNLGNVYFFNFKNTKNPKDYQNALDNFKKAIELDPNYALAYNGIGGAFLLVGQLDGAVFCLEKALELNPALGYALYNLGHAYLLKGDRDKALDCFIKYKKSSYERASPSERKELDDLIQKVKKDVQE